MNNVVVGDKSTAEAELLQNLRSRSAELAALLEECSSHWGFEDPIYRFYHQSFKAYYLQDHVPPHFHAEYGEHEALIEIETWAVYAGSLPNRALGLVREWATMHRDELRQNWTLARSGQPPGAIAPLE